jgi:hypothetical protein
MLPALRTSSRLGADQPQTTQKRTWQRRGSGAVTELRACNAASKLAGQL